MMNKQSTGKAWRWKVATFLPLLALLLMAFGREGEKEPMEIKSAQVQPSPIVGTWKLGSFNYGGGDEWQSFPAEIERLKFITETNFNWIQYAGNERLVTGSAGGTYVLSGDSYTENIEFSGQGMAGYIGKPQKFTVKFEANKMHLSGELSSGLRIKEIWERYQPSDKSSMISPSSTPQKKERYYIWLANDGTVRYNSELTSFDRLAEKVKADVKGNSKLPLNIFMEEGKIDEHTAKIKNTLKDVENLDVIYWSFHQKNETDSNGQVLTKVISKTIDVDSSNKSLIKENKPNNVPPPPRVQNKGLEIIMNGEIIRVNNQSVSMEELEKMIGNVNKDQFVEIISSSATNKTVETNIKDLLEKRNISYRISWGNKY